MNQRQKELRSAKTDQPMALDDNGSTDGQWQLEGLLGQGRTWSIPVEPLPFRVGRHDSCHLKLKSDGISRIHAEISHIDGCLWLGDLGSTNGTFLNHGRLLDRKPLNDGDIVHFGSLEFRISYRHNVRQKPSVTEVTGIFAVGTDLPGQFVNCGREFDELLSNRSVTPVYQPIVELESARIVAYEMLGRGHHPALPIAPLGLFDIAERLGKEITLSHLFRQVGVRAASSVIGHTRLFFNNHPAETASKEFECSLREVRASAPTLPLVLEVHEKSVTDTGLMRSLRDLLTDLGMGLAYDDFGAGQARLLELIQVPPDVLKFDAVLVRDLHQQPAKFQRVLRALVAMAKDLGVDTLAEGVETREEAEACADIGFDSAQGFYFGHPLENPSFRNRSESTPRDGDAKRAGVISKARKRSS